MLVISREPGQEFTLRVPLADGSEEIITVRLADVVSGKRARIGIRLSPRVILERDDMKRDRLGFPVEK